MKLHRSLLSTQLLMWAMMIVTAGMAGAGHQTKKRHPAKVRISISITHIPSAGPGEDSFGDIRGIAHNVPARSRVVIYSLGNTWYVQPYADAPFTDINKNGQWSANIHGGYQFAALLVKPGYKPSSTIDTLPKVGGKILAVARAKRHR